MADPTNRNDPTYSNNPSYVWSGGRWQYVSNPGTANSAPSDNPNNPQRVTGSVVWDPIPSGASVVKKYGGDINNFAGYQNIAQGFREGAVRQQGVNPYNTGIADQSRGAQLALIQQMRAQQAGPSLAGLQGQRGMAQAGQQALMQGGRAGMLGAQNASTGMAGDVGQARLAEIMRSQAGMGGAAGNLRGADLRSAEAQAQAGIRGQTIADQRAQFYGSLGSMLDQARARQALEQFKLGQRIDARSRGLVMDAVNQGVGAGATALSMGATGGGKK
jgi:hypothetical protein